MSNEDIIIGKYIVKKGYLYLETHEYVKEEGDGVYLLGISDYAVKMLNEITYVEVPEAGSTFKKGEVVAVVESLKAAGDVYAPFDLEVIEGNTELDDSPELLNEDPFGKGFIAKVKALTDDMAGLMTAEEYAKMISEEE